MASTTNGNNKIIEIIAGPNGSGKSSFADLFFSKQRRITRFINPDIIAAGLGPIDQEQADSVDHSTSPCENCKLRDSLAAFH